MPNFKEKKSSPYKDTSIKDFYLDLWNAPEIPVDENNRSVVIANEHHKRPDLLSFELYNNPNFWWVFAMVNKNILIDPIEDFTAGTTIRLPDNGFIQRRT